MAMELLERGAATGQIHLLMGAPYTTDLIYDDLFVRYAAEHDNFHYHTAISRETRADGRRGQYVHHFLDERMEIFGPLLENPRTLLYICGLAGMQSGLFQVMAKHGVGEGYFTVRDKLAAIEPAAVGPGTGPPRGEDHRALHGGGVLSGSGTAQHTSQQPRQRD